MNDAIFRTVCVVAAAALVAGPYWPQIRAAATVAAQAIRARAKGIGTWVAVVLLLAAAWHGGIRLPEMPGRTPAVTVDTPSAEMQQLVAPVAEALKAAPLGDRILWAQLWSKAAVVAAGDAVSTEVVLTDTRALRGFTIIALEIGWRRLGQNQPGKYAGLKAAVEAAFASVLGKAEVPVTPELRARYAELARAIAWAGVGKG